MSSTYPHIKPGTNPTTALSFLRMPMATASLKSGRCSPKDCSSLTPSCRCRAVPTSAAPPRPFLADTDGDDREDERRVVFSGFGNADVHHMIHALRWAPWGELYFNQSIYINSFIDTRWGKRRLNGSGLWRFRPVERPRFSRVARSTCGATRSIAGVNHHRRSGRSGRTSPSPRRCVPECRRRAPHPAWPCARQAHGTGCEALSGRHFPAEEWRGSIVENDFRANRTVRYRITDKGSGFAAKEVETLVRSTRKTYRPVDLKVGPDGAALHCRLVQRDHRPRRGRFPPPVARQAHGRIWRLTAKDRPLVERPHIHGAPVDTLLDHLKSPEDYTRNQAKRELATRPHAEVLTKLKTWVDGLSPSDPDFEHHSARGTLASRHAGHSQRDAAARSVKLPGTPSPGRCGSHAVPLARSCRRAVRTVRQGHRG